VFGVLVGFELHLPVPLCWLHAKYEWGVEAKMLMLPPFVEFRIRWVDARSIADRIALGYP
jgi:hypothetical protein